MLDITSTPSEAVVERVAAREGVDPTAIEEPLYEAIDPDALDELAGQDGRGESSIRVAFTYYGYDVVVRPGEPVQLSES